MKPKIAFVTGGYSGEAEISYKSAFTFEKNVDREKFELYKIDITPAGWFYEIRNGEKKEVDKNDFSIIAEGKKIKFDAVLIGIHGTPGEDGKLQGYFDMLGIPYTSCDCTTSALTFNKRYTIAVAGASGIRVSNSVVLFKNNFTSPDEKVKELRFPVFVKPNNGGSSIGMSKVNAPSEELGEAINKAFREDDQVLVEEFIEGREFTIGVFRAKGEIIALPITEVISHNEFFDYTAKYHGESSEETPAEIDEPVAQKIRAEAIKAYRVFNCRGVVRIDFIYNEKEAAPFLLEINTVPGQSEASIVPQQVRIMGWTLTEFYTALIEECLRG
ncbi:MAG TPA: D-alanine--D-alanine ligase [Chitinophagaceae bacterium]|nr:D-alanine--D-alanine ligase [Chitinophagaceae bacterium]